MKSIEAMPKDNNKYLFSVNTKQNAIGMESSIQVLEPTEMVETGMMRFNTALFQQVTTQMEQRKKANYAFKL